LKSFKNQGTGLSKRNSVLCSEVLLSNTNYAVQNALVSGLNFNSFLTKERQIQVFGLQLLSPVHKIQVISVWKTVP